MENQFSMGLFCLENDKTDINNSSETKAFLRYVDDFVRTVRGDTTELLEAVKNLHPNLQYTLETLDDKTGCRFLTWYQKPSDTGIILNYRSCAPLQHKKSIIQGTKHHLFRSTSNWEWFHEALTKMKKKLGMQSVS